MDRTDHELLAAYLDENSEEAFRCLVERHAGLVHGAGLRMVRDPGLAEEVTQTAFLLLARKARSIGTGVIIPGWLYQTTRFTALALLREQRRHQARLKSLEAMEAPYEPAPDWGEITPHLEAAMAKLGETDRNALLTRFFQNKRFSDVARDLGVSEPAAKMRVGRALEKLRLVLAQHGCAVSSACLMQALGRDAAPAASADICSNVLRAVADAQTRPETLAVLAKSTLKFMAWQKTKKTALVLLAALLLASGSILFLTSTRLRCLD